MYSIAEKDEQEREEVSEGEGRGEDLWGGSFRGDEVRMP